HRARLPGEAVAAVVRRRVDRAIEAADQHSIRLAALARDLHSRDARRRVRDSNVRQLADILGDDRVNNLVAVALDVSRRLQRAPEACDNDRIIATSCGSSALRSIGILWRYGWTLLCRRIGFGRGRWLLCRSR